MNCKDPQGTPWRPIQLIVRPHWILALVFTITLFAFTIPSSPPVVAQHFSLPGGLHTLKNKLFKSKRRKRKGRRSKTAPGGTALQTGENMAIAEPPLPVRNPLHKKKRRYKKREQAYRSSRLKSVERTAMDSIFDSVSLKTTPPPLPIRKPGRKRLKKKDVRYSAQQKQSKSITIAALQKPSLTDDPDTALPPLPIRKPRRHPSKVVEKSWSQSLIDDATAQCAALGITIKPLAPIQKGRCGNPAAILLPTIGTVTIRPAATLSCPMVASLQRWFTQSVQPLAQKHFGKKVQKIRNVSSYVCRNRYGDTTTRISEHAYANALDIAAFELQGGEKITILKDWDNAEGEKSAFLHALHSSACKLFGTVLGPNANAAHKDHFHLDRAPRKRSNYCR